MIKTRCLVVFRLAQSCIIYVKLEQDDAEINIASWPGSINQKSSQMRFSAKFQLSPSSLKCFRVLCFTLGI